MPPQNVNASSNGTSKSIPSIKESKFLLNGSDDVLRISSALLVTGLHKDSHSGMSSS